ILGVEVGALEVRVALGRLDVDIGAVEAADDRLARRRAVGALAAADLGLRRGTIAALRPALPDAAARADAELGVDVERGAVRAAGLGVLRGLVVERAGGDVHGVLRVDRGALERSLVGDVQLHVVAAVGRRDRGAGAAGTAFGLIRVLDLDARGDGAFR